MNPRDHWIELRGLLLSLVEGLSPALDEKNSELVRNFIENREFGVAFEWLHSLVLGRSIPITFEQKEVFERLAQLMGFDMPD
jgi:hypothetical protein